MATVREVMQKNFVKIDAEMPITQALAKLAEADERYGLVFDQKQKKAFRGLLDRVLLIKAKLSPEAKAKSFASFPPTVTPETSLLDAVRLMYQYYPCLLPVEEKGKIIGVVRARDLLPAFISLPGISKIKSIDIATKNLIVFDYNARLGNVINILKEKKISHVPIIDKNGKLISVFSLTDLYKHIYPKKQTKMQGLKNKTQDHRSYISDNVFLLDSPVGDFASIPLFTIKPNDDLGSVLKECYEHKVSDLIVEENKKPIGIVTTRDLLKAIIENVSPASFWPIQFIGCEALPGQLFDSVREQVAEFYERAQRLYIRQNVRYFQIHIKRYERKELKKQKYSVHVKLALPSKLFTAEYAHFDLNTAVSWALKALNQQLQSYKEKLKDKEIIKTTRRVQVQRIKPTLKRRKSKRAFANGNALLVLVLVILLLLVLGLWFYPSLTKSMVGATVAKLKSVL